MITYILGGAIVGFIFGVGATYLWISKWNVIIPNDELDSAVTEAVQTVGYEFFQNHFDMEPVSEEGEKIKDEMDNRLSES